MGSKFDFKSYILFHLCHGIPLKITNTDFSLAWSNGELINISMWSEKKESLLEKKPFTWMSRYDEPIQPQS